LVFAATDTTATSTLSGEEVGGWDFFADFFAAIFGSFVFDYQFTAKSFEVRIFEARGWDAAKCTPEDSWGIAVDDREGSAGEAPDAAVARGI